MKEDPLWKRSWMWVLVHNHVIGSEIEGIPSFTIHLFLESQSGVRDAENGL